MLSTEPVVFYEFGQFKLDAANGRLLKENKVISLTQKSFEILHFLVRNKGEVLHKNKFFDVIWEGSFVDETNLTQHIYRIRKAIEDTENGNSYIETIPKYGYRFNAEVKETFENPTVRDDTSESDSRYKNPKFGSNGNTAEPGFTEEIPLPPSDKRSKFHDNPIRADKRSTILTGSIISRFTLAAAFLGALFSFALLQSFWYFSARVSDNKRRTKSVAVLPFRTIGNEKDARLELGMADSLISKLGSLNEMVVTPTESIIDYNKADSSHSREDLFGIGKKLNADIMITGTIQRQDEKVRVTLTFYNVEDKQQLCSAKFDENSGDIFALQDSISTRASQKLVSEINDHLKQTKNTAANLTP